MKSIMDFLWVLFHPTFWLMNEEYSKEWDSILNELMLKYDFIPNRKYTAKLGKLNIWIANYPYACFGPYNNSGKYEFRPSRITIRNAQAKLEKDYLKYSLGI